MTQNTELHSHLLVERPLDLQKVELIPLLAVSVESQVGKHLAVATVC